MQFAVEAWDPDYGTGGDAGTLDASTDTVDASLEFALEDWRPVVPRPLGDEPKIYFVDGVRRIDARIWVTDGPRVLPGSCATVAAGVVACTREAAVIQDIAVRHLVLTPPTEEAGDIETEFGRYEHVEIATGSPEDLYLGIHEEMTRLESQTMPTVETESLIVFDGPLRGRSTPGAVGLIKSQHVQYLDLGQQATVIELGAGQRTPLFVVGQGRFARWSWYLRLPGPPTHGWAGIVRCEMPTTSPGRSVAVTTASELADRVSTALPRFASEPHKEHRAPQNLYPISGLERTLRNRLGDQRLLQRGLRRASGRT